MRKREMIRPGKGRGGRMVKKKQKDYIGRKIVK